MVKGMRPGGGGRRPPSPSVLDRILLRRIESSNLGSAAASTFPSPSDADDLVDHLRSRYPDYARIKLQPFSHRVRRILLQLHPVSNGDDEDEEDDDASGRTPSTPSRKRHRKRDEGRPQLFDPERPSQRRRKHRDRATTSSSDEDGVFDAAVDPEFDITKYMLREKYGKPKSTSKDEVEMENAVEKSKRRALGTADGSGVEEAPASQCRIGCGADSASDFGETDRPSFGDFGGIGRVLEELEMEVLVPLCHPQLPRWLGVRPTAGILLHGPPGCGKTRLAHAIANETGLPFYKISATEVVSGISGESEGNIRDLFNKAYRTAPSIVFIDEIDAIASKRENMQKEMERRIVTQLMTCMDASHQTPKLTNADSDSETSEKQLGYVLVIGATNRPDAVDPALRRPGRFDKEIALGVPDENARKEILSVITKKLRLDGTFNLLKIARTTPGFVGADLRALVDKAGNLAMKRIIDRRRSEFSRQRKKDDKKWWKQTWGADEYHNLSITMEDFEEAAKLVQPSLRREGFSSIPNVKWEDVGGLHILRKEFDRDIVQRIKNPEFFEELDETSGTGFLLYGPPGCGKTLIAKAVANEAGANFIHIKGPELLNKYVGESELAVRTIFTRARTCSPCILFFDEVDALTTKRGKDGGWVVERILDQLLVELDGADERCGVHVIGATNRLDVVDPAVLRPGRLGKVMYVPLPSADDRVMILKAIGRKKPLASNVDLEAIGRNEACTNFSGADLAALMKEAVMAAIDEKINAMHDGNLCTESSVIKSSHFEQALKKVRPSVSEKERMYYEVLSRTYRVT